MLFRQVEGLERDQKPHRRHPPRSQPLPGEHVDLLAQGDSPESSSRGPTPTHDHSLGPGPPDLLAKAPVGRDGIRPRLPGPIRAARPGAGARSPRFLRTRWRRSTRGALSPGRSARRPSLRPGFATPRRAAAPAATQAVPVSANEPIASESGLLEASDHCLIVDSNARNDIASAPKRRTSSQERRRRDGWSGAGHLRTRATRTMPPGSWPAAPRPGDIRVQT